MKDELREKLDDFLKNIKGTTTKLERQRKALRSKLDNGQMTQEEFSEYTRLGQELSKQRALYDEYKSKVTIFELYRNEIKKLTAARTSKKQKEEIINYLVSEIHSYSTKTFNKLIADNPNITDNYSLEDRIEGLRNVINAYPLVLEAQKRWTSKSALKKALNAKVRDLKTLEAYNHDTTDVKKEIKSLEEDLKYLEAFENTDVQKQYDLAKQEYDNLTRYDYSLLLISEQDLRTKLENLSQKDISDSIKGSLLDILNKLIDTLELSHYEDLIKEFKIDNQDEKTQEQANNEEAKDDKKEEQLPEGGKDMDNKTDQKPKTEPVKQPEPIKKPEPPKQPEPVKKDNSKIQKAICYALSGAIGISLVAGAYLIGRSSRKGSNSNNNNNTYMEYVDPNYNSQPEELIEAKPTPTPVPEAIIAMQNSNPEVVDVLREIGYSDNVAYFMAFNFSEDQIAILKQVPYDSRVESYAQYIGFNYNYINDYENARATQNLTAQEAIDYVNRAYVLQSYNLFNGANINDYTRFVVGIANRDIMTHKNDEASLALNDVMNEIAAHVIDTKITGINSITNEDLNRIEALRDIAPAGSDLDEFLEGFVDIVEACLADPYNMDLSNKAYMYLEIFVKSLNNVDNPLNHLNNIEASLEENVLMEDPIFNERAKVQNPSDFAIAWDDVVGPLWFTFIPIGDGESPEYQRWDSLFQTASSAVNIVYNQTCGEEMSLTRESGE